MKRSSREQEDLKEQPHQIILALDRLMALKLIDILNLYFLKIQPNREWRLSECNIGLMSDHGMKRASKGLF